MRFAWFGMTEKQKIKSKKEPTEGRPLQKKERKTVICPDSGS
jgi:hypothetical protein